MDFNQKLIMTVRLGPNKTILQKKGQGWLIHVSNFINEETGCLIIPNSNGTSPIPEENDAQKIIYPGAAGDLWWDTAQLLEQMRTKAIPIFEKAYPGSQALFIFDQSLAHTSLGPDALHAFNMNKSDGGKQCNTIIPNDTTVPDPSAQGKPQKMTTADGEAKGLEVVLTECSFSKKGI